MPAPNPPVVSVWHAVIAYVLGTSFFLYAFIQRVSPSVMTENLMRDFSINAAGIGILSSMYFYTYALMQLPVGILVDRFGPRKLMAGAALVCVTASLLFASSNSLFTASLSRAFIGAAVAFPFVCTLAIASTFFSATRFAMLTGVLMAVGMIGAIAGQAPLRMLIEYSSWRTTFVLMAAAALVLSGMLFVLVPRRPDQSVADKPTAILTGFKAVCRNPQSWWSAGVGFGLTTVMLGFSGLWAVPWLVSTRSFSATQAGAVSSTLFLGVMIGGPIIGWFSDALGKRKPIILTGSIACLVSITLIVYGGLHSATLLSILFLVYGLSAGSMVVCFGLVREWNRPEHNATALGLVNMCVVGSGALMQPLIGWLLDYSWSGMLVNGARIYNESSYNLAFSTLIATTVFALVCALLVKETNCSPQLSDQ
ncbi:hypothetical protein AB833_12615 [Chromatiales bacterium (ex Bugula neritina AB1)]|nr:hypothetical protein AB833_12615 [Chromatiales bacterium (ex Bugula neritina AB1)]